jgi:hypothetical protein
VLSTSCFSVSASGPNELPLRNNWSWNSAFALLATGSITSKETCILACILLPIKRLVAMNCLSMTHITGGLTVGGQGPLVAELYLWFFTLQFMNSYKSFRLSWLSKVSSFADKLDEAFGVRLYTNSSGASQISTASIMNRGGDMTIWDTALMTDVRYESINHIRRLKLILSNCRISRAYFKLIATKVADFDALRRL